MSYVQYPNLKKAMDKQNLKYGALASVLGRGRNTISGWMHGLHGGFSVTDAIVIWQEFFPDIDFLVLFRHAKNMGGMHNDQKTE